MNNDPHLRVVTDQTAHQKAVAAAAQAQRIAQNQVSPTIGLAALGQTASTDPSQPVALPPEEQGAVRDSFAKYWLLSMTMGGVSGAAVGSLAGRDNRAIGAAIGASIHIGLINLAGASYPLGYASSTSHRLVMGVTALAALGLGGWLAFRK